MDTARQIEVTARKSWRFCHSQRRNVLDFESFANFVPWRKNLSETVFVFLICCNKKFKPECVRFGATASKNQTNLKDRTKLARQNVENEGREYFSRSRKRYYGISDVR